MKNKLPIVTLVASIITILIGIPVLTGWFMHNHFPRSLISVAVKMKFNAALAFLLPAVALQLCCFFEKRAICHRIRGRQIYPVKIILNNGFDKIYFFEHYSEVWKK